MLAATIQQDLKLSDVDYSRVTSAFLISYTIMYAVSGRLVDVLGTRRSFLLFVSSWSVANMLHGFARSHTVHVDSARALARRGIVALVPDMTPLLGGRPDQERKDRRQRVDRLAVMLVWIALAERGDAGKAIVGELDDQRRRRLSGPVLRACDAEGVSQRQPQDLVADRDRHA